ncbi:MAG: hypothetical protein RIQ81_1261 [Pseudomonadota bacterium]
MVAQINFLQAYCTGNRRQRTFIGVTDIHQDCITRNIARCDFNRNFLQRIQTRQYPGHLLRIKVSGHSKIANGRR